MTYEDLLLIYGSPVAVLLLALVGGWILALQGKKLDRDIAAERSERAATAEAERAADAAINERLVSTLKAMRAARQAGEDREVVSHFSVHLDDPLVTPAGLGNYPMAMSPSLFATWAAGRTPRDDGRQAELPLSARIPA